jgi:peptidyl-prolyl cis-trans isomerase SurA
MPAATFRRLLIGSLVAGIIASLPVVTRAEILEQILVKVNGEILTKTELEARQVAVIRARQQQKQLPAQLPDDELKKQIAALTPQLLVDAVDEILVLQRGKDLGYRLTDAQFDSWLANVKKENKIETDEQLQDALKADNMTMADLRKSVDRNFVIDQVQRAEVLGRINITEPEERKYYDEHPSEFTTPSAITVREILLKTPGDTKTINVGLDEETKQKAETLRTQLAAGGDFEKAVADNSAAPSKANGGLVGPLNLNDLNPAIANVLKPLKAGQVSPVVQVQGGYEIFKVETVTTPTVQPFEQARTQIADVIINQRRDVEIEKYIRRLRSAAIIEWKNADLQKLYEAEAKKPMPARTNGGQ